MPSPSRVVQDAIQATSIRFNNIVYEMRQAGTDVTVLSLGEAYFDVPLFPMDDLPFPALYHYSHSRGIPELRQEIAAYYQQMFGVPIDPQSEILVTAGSKAAIYFALLAILNPGDEALVHEPTWVSYPEQVKLVHAKPVMMPYSCRVKDYESYITKKTRLIIINNPHNPRGEVMGERDLRYLLDLAAANDLYVLADEAYSDFVVDGTFTSLGKLDRTKANVVVCNSISKNFGISGWRLGYAISNSGLIEQILKINQHVITCPATILQLYVAKHFQEILGICRPQIAALSEKRKAVAKMMDSLGLSYLPGSSTFYFFVSTAPTRLTSEEFCMRLLREQHVCVVPGVGYGASCDGFVRVSFGTESLERIEGGLRRMRSLIDSTASTRAAAVG